MSTTKYNITKIIHSVILTNDDLFSFGDGHDSATSRFISTLDRVYENTLSRDKVAALINSVKSTNAYIGLYSDGFDCAISAIEAKLNMT